MRTGLILATLGTLALSGAPALAQTAAPPADMASHMAMMQKHMNEMRAREAADIKILLKLRPDQEAGFAALQAAKTPPAPKMMMMDGPPPAMTTPQHMDAMDKMAAEHQARHAKAEAALRTFYASLSPDQQASFDALQRLRRGGEHEGGQMMTGHAGPGSRMMMMHMGPPPQS